MAKASDCGSEDRGFKSHHPPHKKGQVLRLVLFSTKSPRLEGEILLPSVKSGLYSGEIAGTVGGFHFTERHRLSISPKTKPLVSPFAKRRTSLSHFLRNTPLKRHLKGGAFFCLISVFLRRRSDYKAPSYAWLFSPLFYQNAALNAPDGYKKGCGSCRSLFVILRTPQPWSPG